MINRKLLHDIPRRITASGDAIISPEQTADLAYIIERGTAKNTRTGKTFGPNTLLLPLELFALENYRSRIIAATPCAVICCPHQLVQKALAAEDRLTWPLSRSLAGDIMRRHGVDGMGVDTA
tara:strand:+ start:417 stop:782 length:366 start_codon:yes stop_codon:yes gene_type:complete